MMFIPDNKMCYKRGLATVFFCMISVCFAYAQQYVYDNLNELLTNRGDELKSLVVERRAKHNIYLLSGADYIVSCNGNKSMTRYLRSRAYAVRSDSTLYVNCKKMRYKHYTFGGKYAQAYEVKGHIFWCAQPVGQEASSLVVSDTDSKLGGEVGDAIQASGLVYQRVVYEIDPITGKSIFVGKKRVNELLGDRTDLKELLEKETSESEQVILPYLLKLK